jgi:hypothetical protein
MFDVRFSVVQVSVLQLCPVAVPRGRVCRMRSPLNFARCGVDMRISPARAS